MRIAAAASGIESRNPANLDDVVCEARLGDADTFVDAVPRGARGAARLGGRSGARARQRDQADRADRRGQQGGALAARDARDRQALPGVARRGPGDHRHLRLLPLRGPPPLRPDRAERDAGQAALHLPQPGRRRRDHHGRQLPGRRALVVPRAGDPVRQRRGLEAGGVLAGARATRSRGCSSRAACRTASSTWSRATARPPSRASSERSTRGSSTRSASPAPRLSARGSASSPAATASRPASSSAARTRSS